MDIQLLKVFFTTAHEDSISKAGDEITRWEAENGDK
jgi:hypothetical protein